VIFEPDAQAAAMQPITMAVVSAANLFLAGVIVIH
jgi:hypothetical protein